MQDSRITMIDAGSGRFALGNVCLSLRLFSVQIVTIASRFSELAFFGYRAFQEDAMRGKVTDFMVEQRGFEPPILCSQIVIGYLMY